MDVNVSLPSTHNLFADRAKELALDNSIDNGLSKNVEGKRKANPVLDGLSKIITDAQNDNKKTVSSPALKALVEVDNDLSDIEETLDFVKEKTDGGNLTDEDKKQIIDLLFKLDQKLAAIQKKLDAIGEMIKRDDKASKEQERLMITSNVLRKQAEDQRSNLEGNTPAPVQVQVSAVAEAK